MTLCGWLPQVPCEKKLVTYWSARVYVQFDEEAWVCVESPSLRQPQVSIATCLPIRINVYILQYIMLVQPIYSTFYKYVTANKMLFNNLSQEIQAFLLKT
jgi:hypothetical protein